MGFSQGCILATFCGLAVGAKGVGLMGGVGCEGVYLASKRNYVGREIWMRWEELMPKDAKFGSDSPKFMVMAGGADYTVPKKKLQAMLGSFDARYHFEEGLEHEFPKAWRGLM